MTRANQAIRLPLIIALVLVLFLVWGAAAYDLHRKYSNDLHEAEVRTQIQAQVFTEYSQSTLKRVNEVILDLRPEWDGDWQKFASLVKRRQENIDDITFQVAIIDREGIMAFSNLSKPNDRTDLSEREHFRVHRDHPDADVLFISRPLLGKVSKKWSIQVTRPILRAGRFDGVIVVSVSPAQFVGFAEKLGLKESDSMTVVRDTGEVMARWPEDASILGKILNNRPFLGPNKVIPSGGNYRIKSAFDGVDRIFGFSRSSIYGMTFVLGESVEGVLSGYKAYRKKILQATATITLIIVALLLMLYRSLMSLDDMRQQLQAILKLSPDGFVSFDKNYHVKYVSPAFLCMTRLDESELMGVDEERLSQLLRNLSVNQAQFPGVSALRKSALTELETENAAAGQRCLIELNDAGKAVLELGVRLSQSDSVPQVLYVRDVTHEVEVDRMKTEFISTAAHELRTPMASIYGYSALMLTEEFSKEESREFIDTIHRQSQVMVSIINELLDLVRIESRRGKDFNLEKIDVFSLISDALANFRPADGSPAPVVSKPTRQYFVNADESKISQAINNVLSNAYKYSSVGSAAELDIVEPMVDEKPKRIGIRIRDHGIGMSREQMSRVGERFYRADSSGKIPGTGLGMSIVKEILQIHGGSFSIESELGRGTSFTLWLPVL